MGAKALVIILFLARLLHRATQFEMAGQVAELKGESGKLHHEVEQDEMGCPLPET